jgi:predicted SAM-dependent methyltransferase
MSEGEPLRLHIGGHEVRPGWRIFDIRPGPGVDYVGDCRDLSRFPDDSVEAIYASHVLEHLGFQQEIHAALREFRRVLRPGGELRASVPDFEVMCRLFVDPALTAPQRLHVMMMTFGEQTHEHDFHKVGLNWEFLASFIIQAGFSEVHRVETHDLFDDASGGRAYGRLVSLNVRAVK